MIKPLWTAIIYNEKNGYRELFTSDVTEKEIALEQAFKMKKKFHRDKRFKIKLYFEGKIITMDAKEIKEKHTMTGRVNKGKLEIQRGKEWTMQICPFKPYDKECGIYCPHFNEHKDFISLSCGGYYGTTINKEDKD